MKMDGEMQNIATVWLSVAVCLSCCYIMGRIVPKGFTRLALILPIVILFFLLPLKLSLVISVGGMTGFLIAFLGNLKLLLFAFGKGPLVAAEASVLHFVAVGCLPIKVRINDEVRSKGKRRNKFLNYVVKGLLLAAVVKAFDYTDQIHPKVQFLLFCLIIYFLMEISLFGMGAFAEAALGLELEPQFNQPHLSTSLQDFWGHRWNLMVPTILRPAVYEPVSNFFGTFMVRRWTPLPAILATFLVSGLMHEIIFYYIALKREPPNWSITLFFLFHGVCLTLEVAAKKFVANRWRLPKLVSGALTITFVTNTGIWWYMPELAKIDADRRGIEELQAAGEFIRMTIQTILHPFI